MSFTQHVRQDVGDLHKSKQPDGARHIPRQICRLHQPEEGTEEGTSANGPASVIASASSNEAWMAESSKWIGTAHSVQQDRTRADDRTASQKCERVGHDAGAVIVRGSRVDGDRQHQELRAKSKSMSKRRNLTKAKKQQHASIEKTKPARTSVRAASVLARRNRQRHRRCQQNKHGDGAMAIHTSHQSAISVGTAEMREGCRIHMTMHSFRNAYSHTRMPAQCGGWVSICIFSCAHVSSR